MCYVDATAQFFFLIALLMTFILSYEKSFLDDLDFHQKTKLYILKSILQIRFLLTP